jgi:HSF-type DNA-binding
MMNTRPVDVLDTNGLIPTHVSFPRTGKRGVPQQFPRRLYEMLDSETKCIEASASYPNIISWSMSGKAFRIFNVLEFASTVLPKYFRTTKFSSFQRNLNLVSF